MASMSQSPTNKMSPEMLDSLTESDKQQIGAQILGLLMGASQSRPSANPMPRQASQGQTQTQRPQQRMQRFQQGMQRPPMPRQQNQKMPASASRAIRGVIQNRYGSLPNPAMMQQPMMQQPMMQFQPQQPQIYQNLGQPAMVSQRPLMAFNPNFMV